MSTLPSVTAFFGWTAQHIEQDENGVRVVVSETRHER